MMVKQLDFTNPPPNMVFNSFYDPKNMKKVVELSLVPKSLKYKPMRDIMRTEKDALWFSATKHNSIWTVRTNDEQFEVSGEVGDVKKTLSCYAYQELKKKELFENENIDLKTIPTIADNVFQRCMHQFKLK